MLALSLEIHPLKLDRLDARILSELQRNGRSTVVEVAERIGLSGSPCARRIHQLEESGVIQSYTAVLEPLRLGLKVQAFVQVKLERHTDENVTQFRRDLDAIEQIIGCYAISGEYDFLLQVITTDLDSLSNIVLKQLLKFPSVRDVHSHIVLESIKHSPYVPLGHL